MHVAGFTVDEEEENGFCIPPTPFVPFLSYVPVLDFVPTFPPSLSSSFSLLFSFLPLMIEERHTPAEIVPVLALSRCRMPRFHDLGSIYREGTRIFKHASLKRKRRGRRFVERRLDRFVNEYNRFIFIIGRLTLSIHERDFLKEIVYAILVTQYPGRNL